MVTAGVKALNQGTKKPVGSKSSSSTPSQWWHLCRPTDRLNAVNRNYRCPRDGYWHVAYPGTVLYWSRRAPDSRGFLQASWFCCLPTGVSPTLISPAARWVTALERRCSTETTPAPPFD